MFWTIDAPTITLPPILQMQASLVASAPRLLAVNQAPKTTPDNIAITLGESITLQPLTNDYDMDGQLQPDSIVIVQPPQHGQVQVQNNGSVLYTHTGTQPLPDSFHYTVKDNDGAVSLATKVTIHFAGSTPLGLTLKLRAYLQGAYDSNTGLMHDQLRAQGLLPLTQPYTDTPFHYQGTEQTSASILATEGDDAPVDWLLVELRDADAPDTLIARQAVLLQRDGDLADAITYQSLINFPAQPAGNYHIALRHRNHLAIRTAQAIALNTTTTTDIDFASPETAIANPTSRFVNQQGLALLWAGNSNGDQRIIASGPGNDRLNILETVLKAPNNSAFNTNYLAKGYSATDLNLDGYTMYVGVGNDTKWLVGNILSHPDNTHLMDNFIIQTPVP